MTTILFLVLPASHKAGTPAFGEHPVVSSAIDITMHDVSKKDRTLFFMFISSNNSMIFFVNYRSEITMKKRKNEPLHLKDSLLHLKN